MLPTCLARLSQGVAAASNRNWLRLCKYIICTFFKIQSRVSRSIYESPKQFFKNYLLIGQVVCLSLCCLPIRSDYCCTLFFWPPHAFKLLSSIMIIISLLARSVTSLDLGATTSPPPNIIPFRTYPVHPNLVTLEQVLNLEGEVYLFASDVMIWWYTEYSSIVLFFSIRLWIIHISACLYINAIFMRVNGKLQLFVIILGKHL